MVTAITSLSTQTVDERWTQIEKFLDFKNLREADQNFEENNFVCQNLESSH
jgi:hypothetical protein